jgi:hypothetical protein
MDPRAAVDDLAVEPITGYRVWRLAHDAGALRLVAMTRRTTWPALEPMRGRCPEHGADDVPGPDCMCGLYAASSLRSLVRAAVLQHGTIGVVGAVSMWGRVIEHDRGVRSSLAYPARIRLVCGPCLSERRGAVVPVTVVQRDDDPVPICARHLRPGERGIPADGVESALLDAYAVELLPLEVAVRGLGHRRGTATILRRLDAAPRVPERLRRPARAIALAAAVALIAVGVLTLPGAPGQDRSAAGPPARSVAAPDERGADTGAGALPRTDASPATAPRKNATISVPGAICGVVGAGVLQAVECREGHADAVGITSTPPAGRSSCDGRFEWYTRTSSWSACWFVDAATRRRLERHPT